MKISIKRFPPVSSAYRFKNLNRILGNESCLKGYENVNKAFSTVLDNKRIDNSNRIQDNKSYYKEY